MERSVKFEQRPKKFEVHTVKEEGEWENWVQGRGRVGQGRRGGGRESC